MQMDKKLRKEIELYTLLNIFSKYTDDRIILTSFVYYSNLNEQKLKTILILHNYNPELVQIINDTNSTLNKKPNRALRAISSSEPLLPILLTLIWAVVIGSFSFCAIPCTNFLSLKESFLSIWSR